MDIIRLACIYRSDVLWASQKQPYVESPGNNLCQI